MPVLIIIMFCINDILEMKRYFRLTKFATLQAINMLQNVSQGRGDKKITKSDFDKIAKACMLGMPLCTTTEIKNLYNDQEFLYSLNCALVQGVGNDRCKVLWTCYSGVFNYEVFDYNSQNQSGQGLTQAHAFTLQSRYGHAEKIGQEVSSTALFEDLHIKNGERKAIVEVALYKGVSKGRKDSINYVSELIGLRLLRVPGYKGHGVNDQSLFFPSHTIFSPNPDIFTDQPPQ